MLVNNRTKIAAVGVGSAGIKIVSLLSRKPLVVDRCLYVSCDPGDFSTVEPKDTILIESQVEQKLTPAIVRGLALGSAEALREAVSRSKLVFVVAGLGGATGSGLAPLIASIAQKCGATVVGIAVMPFGFEKSM